MRARRRATNTVAAAVIVAVAAAVAVANAAVVSVPTGRWGRVAASVEASISAQSLVARLSTSNRPLSPEVSVFTDGTYGAIPGETLPAGCPTSLAIAGDLGAANNEFSVPASRVSINGSACTGETPDSSLNGTYGPPLAEELAQINASELLQIDPKLGVAISDPGALTCGSSTWMGDGVALVFFVVEGVPSTVYRDATAQNLTCVLVVTEGVGTPPVETPTAA